MAYEVQVSLAILCTALMITFGWIYAWMYCNCWHNCFVSCP